jgi:hypothetical protein
MDAATGCAKIAELDREAGQPPSLAAEHSCMIRGAGLVGPRWTFDRRDGILRQENSGKRGNFRERQ